MATERTVKILSILMLVVFAIMFMMILIGMMTDDMTLMWDYSLYFFALFFILIIAMALVGIIGRSKGRNSMDTKRCASCSSAMGLTEHVCPKCRVIQPWSSEQQEKRWNE